MFLKCQTFLWYLLIEIIEANDNELVHEYDKIITLTGLKLISSVSTLIVSFSETLTDKYFVTKLKTCYLFLEQTKSKNNASGIFQIFINFKIFLLQCISFTFNTKLWYYLQTIKDK